MPDPPPVDPAATIPTPAANPFAPPASTSQRATGTAGPAGPPLYLPPPYPNAYPPSYGATSYGYGYPAAAPPPPPGPRRKWGWWIALGLAVAVLGLSGVVWAVVSIGQNVGSAMASADNNQPPGPDDGSGDRLSDLQAGDCFDADGPLTDTDVFVGEIDCSQSHSYEVFFYFQENDGGNSSPSSAAYVCRQEAAGRVDPGLQVIGVASGSVSVDNGFPEVYCVIKAPSAKWSGSHSHGVRIPPAA